MTITEALEKGNGKAELPGRKGYAMRDDEDGMLAWFDVSMWEPISNVQYDSLIRTDWLPYSPEPEKCEACREADELEARHDFLMYPFNISFVRHLRSHCQCKKEAQC